MIEIPGRTGVFSFSPFGSAPLVLRRWAGEYGAQFGFTSPRPDRPGAFWDNHNQDAFRHGLVTGGVYLEMRQVLGNQPNFRDNASFIDESAARRALGLGAMNESYRPNEVLKALRDYHNNYEGVILAREFAALYGPNATNDQWADFVAAQVQSDLHTIANGGTPRFILTDTDPRITPTAKRGEVDVYGNYDQNRLPAGPDGQGLVPNSAGLNPGVVRSFADRYGPPPAASSPAPPS